MKKVALIVVVAVGFVAWVLLWFRNPQAVATSAARPWPGAMGKLDAAKDRWPQLRANDASVKLTELAKSLPQQEGVDNFVALEITSGYLTIDPPPTLVDVSVIRELMLREPIIWERRVEFDNVQVGQLRTEQMKVARALIASALGKARAKNPEAWDDLHAVWKLSNSLEAHPQMMAQTAALTMARMINAVAWKMPLPAPAWFGQLQAHDNVQPLLEAFQYQAASYTGGWMFQTKWLAASVDHDRQIAEDLFNRTYCDVNAPMNDLGTDLSSVWRRAFRYRAEREATANALLVREGKAIETASRCSDGGWTFDGTTLRFSREIATVAPDSPMPLVLRVKP